MVIKVIFLLIGPHHAGISQPQYFGGNAEKFSWSIIPCITEQN